MSSTIKQADQPHVIIVGAGPGGLALARYLQLHRVPCTIYEREVSATARAQGGSLDLHHDTGLKLLRETGLYEQAETMMRSEGEALKLLDKTGKVFYDENTENKGGILDGRGRPEIDRTDLRNLLIDSLEPGTIQWDHGIKTCRALSTDTYELTFLNDAQPAVTTSLLVGADGVFSRIRPLLHDIRPPYSGISMYDMMIPSASMTPESRDFVGDGMCMAMSDRKGLFAQTNSGGKCKCYAFFTADEDYHETHPLPETGKKEAVLQMFDDWAPQLKQCILSADEESIVPRKIYAYDPKLKWKSPNVGVTVIGDAAHVMSPAAGEGVNQALADALELGQTLVQLLTAPPQRASSAPFPLSLVPFLGPQPHPAHPRLVLPPPAARHKALRSFERGMMKRARPQMYDSRKNLGIMFGPDGAQAFVNRFYWMMVEGTWDMTVGWVLTSISEAVQEMFEKD